MILNIAAVAPTFRYYIIYYISIYLYFSCNGWYKPIRAIPIQDQRNSGVKQLKKILI